MLLSRIFGPSFRAATPENPRFDLNSPEAWDALGAERSSTGQAITPESALKFSAWWRGVTLLARGVAKCPFHVYERSEPEIEYGSTPDLDHPAYKLLRWKVNETMTAFHFRLAITGHAVNRGNGFAYINRTGGGDPAELWLLDPDKTTPVKVQGELWYVTTMPDTAEQRKLPAADVYHIRGFGYDGMQGYPAWKMAKEAIGIAKAAEKFKGSRYKNAARPSVVLQTERPMVDTVRQQLRQDWERMHTGIDNSHRTAILDNGLKAVTMSYTAEEMQEIEQSALTIRDVANFLGIPSSKLCDVAGIKYASKEQDDQAFIDDGLDFWFCIHEHEAWDKLLTTKEQNDGTHVCQFNRESIIRSDMTTLANYLRTATGGRPWMTPNEARDKVHLEPSEDPDADKLLTPLNMGQGGADNKPTDAPPVQAPTPPPDDKGSPPAKDDGKNKPPRPKPSKAEAFAEKAILSGASRMVRRVGTAAIRASKDPVKWSAFLASFRTEHGEAFIDALELHTGTWLLREVEQEFHSLTESGKCIPEAVADIVASQEIDLPCLAFDEFMEMADA